MLLSIELIDTINKQLTNIINLDFGEWKSIDKEMKIKILHNLCNRLKKESIIKEDRELRIPLKSLKPKKMVQYCGFSKTNNIDKYNIFLKRVLDYTFEYRNKYIKLKKRKYYTYNNLGEVLYNEIINDYNEIVFNFLIENLDEINVTELYNNLLGNNKEKVIKLEENYKKIKLEKENNKIKIYFGENILLIMKLIINSNQMTNNIPVNYLIELINNY